MHKGISAWNRLLLYLDPKGKTPKDHIKQIIKRLPNAIEDQFTLSEKQVGSMSSNFNEMKQLFSNVIQDAQNIVQNS